LYNFNRLGRMNTQYINKLDDISPSFYTWFSEHIEPLFDYHNPWEETEEINYKLNNVGLRCDDFKYIKNSESHTVFAGCEFTIPMDVKYEDGWAYKIHSEFYKNKCDFINISYPGVDSNRLIYNILKYINTYGKPSRLFILMPELIRSYGWWPEAKGFKPKMYRQHAGGVEHNLMASPHDLPVPLLALKYIQSIMFLDQYCRDTNIDLIWTSWDSQTNLFLSRFNLKGFFSMHHDDNLNQINIYNSFKKEIEKTL